MVRLAFVGVGGYGAWHLHGFQAFAERSEVNVVALVDPSSEALAAAGRVYPNAFCFRHFRDLLSGVEIDGVVISVPIPWHEELVHEFLRHDLYILLEKPPVPLLSQLDGLIQADRKQRVMVAFQQIYSHGVDQAKRAILAGNLGRLRALSTWGIWPRGSSYYQRASWAGSVSVSGRAVFDGPCTNGCSHFLNNLLFLSGTGHEEFALPEEVSGELYRSRPIPSYDIGCTFGAIGGEIGFHAAFSHAGSVATPACTVIQGENAIIRIDQDGEEWVDPEGRRHRCDDGRDRMRAAFLKFCQGDSTANLTPLESARGYVMLTNLMFQSARRVHDLPLDSVQPVQSPDSGELRMVRDLDKVLAVASSRGCSLRKAGAPWSTPGRMLRREALDELRFVEEYNVRPR